MGGSSVEVAKLWIVPTPIGNLGDITLRAIELLRETKIILAEDTRELKKLLDSLDIPHENKQIHSYRDQNHSRVTPKILDWLAEGNQVALSSDRGTPLISDPGFKLIRELTQAGYSVECLPGPTALIPAVVDSALPTDKFIFLGFLPKKSGKRIELLYKCLVLEMTLIIYESPFRVAKLLEELKEFELPVYVSLSKDLSKLHANTWRGTAAELAQEFSSKRLKGEWVIVASIKN